MGLASVMVAVDSAIIAGLEVFFEGVCLSISFGWEFRWLGQLGGVVIFWMGSICFDYRCVTPLFVAVLSCLEECGVPCISSSFKDSLSFFTKDMPTL